MLNWPEETSLTDKALPRLEKERLPPAKEASSPVAETPDTFEARWRNLVSRQ
jgi:hypothetical protein